MTDAPAGYWGKLAASASGSVLLALNGNAPIASGDSGRSWTTIDSPDEPYVSVALSADGNKLAAIADGGGIYLWRPTVPVIAAQPQMQIVSQGTNAALDVVVLSTLPVAYQWQIDGTNLIGATNALLVLSNVSPASVGAYSVLVSNSYGSALSSNAPLVVLPAVITTEPQPESQTVVAGLGVSYSVCAESTATLSYQWEFNQTNLVRATNATLSLNAVIPSDSGTYSVIVSNFYGVVVSSNAVLSVVPAFISTLPPNWGISDAILGGSVSTGSNSTVVWFNWGADTNYGNATPALPVDDGVVSLAFSNRITGLAPYTSYHYQAAASNTLGVVLGPDATFETAPRFVLTNGTNGAWGSIAWSADGGKIFASSNGTLYLSTNDGAAWLPFSSAGLTTFIPSADGSKLAGINGNVFYLATNSGATWSSNNTPTNFTTFAASADLSKMLALGGSQLYVSTNIGSGWTLTSAPSVNWTSLACSADGSKLFALDVENEIAEGNGNVGIIYLSTNFGGGWNIITELGYEFYVSSMACSADGATLVMGADSSAISTNSGNSWQFSIPPEGLNAACSSNGATIILVTGGPILQRKVYVSPDYGGTWALANAPVVPVPEPVLISSDGTKFAALDNGNIYISESSPPPVLNVAISSGNVILSWMQPVSTFILQQSSDLANWSAVTNAPTLNITNLQNQVILPISQNQSFYRLKTP
jgi:hypothetical protein